MSAVDFAVAGWAGGRTVRVCPAARLVGNPVLARAVDVFNRVEAIGGDASNHVRQRRVLELVEVRPVVNDCVEWFAPRLAVQPVEVSRGILATDVHVQARVALRGGPLLGARRVELEHVVLEVNEAETAR